MSTAQRWINRVLGLRPEELHRVGAMSALLGLIITTSYIVKPVRNSLFLSQHGAERLPYVYILVALVLGFVAAGFARLISRFGIQRVFMVSAAFFAASLTVFWWVVRSGQGGFVFYVWVSIFTIVMPSLFWLYANYIFYSNEAKRIFGVLTAGGILGSIGGGGMASFLVRFTGTAGLLLAAAAVVMGAASLFTWIEIQEKDRTAERRSDLRRKERRHLAGETKGAFSLITRSRYLSFITLLVVLTTVTSTLVDYQLNAVAERSYPSMDSLTGFFGRFFATINTLAFLLQLFFAGRIFSHFGVGGGLLFLPVALACGSLAFFLVPGLWTAAAAKASDDGLSNSLNKSSLEILWLPITLEVKNRVKAWLDIFGERASRGIGGLTLLLLTGVLSLTVDQVSLAVLCLLAPWLVVVFVLRREYVTQFRTSLARRDIDIGALTAEFQDQNSLRVLRQVLSGADERQTLYALGLLPGTRDESLWEPAVRLTSHPSAAIRTASLRLLGSTSNPPRLENIFKLSRDASPEVSAEAVGLLLKTDHPRGREELIRIFHSGDVPRIHAVLTRMEDSPDLLEGVLDEDFVRRYHQSETDEERELAARALGFLPVTTEVIDLLTAFLADASPPVARSAAASAGKLRHHDLLSPLISQLPRRPLRVAARKALARFDPQVVNTVVEWMADPEQDVRLRRALPQVLAEFEDQHVAEGILARLPQVDLPLHYQAIKALGKMRARYSGLRFPTKEVDRLLHFEGSNYCTTARRRLILGKGDGAKGSHALVLRALEERLEFTRERIFRLLGLIYPAGDIFNTWHRIVHGRPSVRAAALEFLGNLLSGLHREAFLPLLEASSWEEISIQGERFLDRSRPSFQEALIEVIRGNDPWLAACSVTLVGELGLTEALGAVKSVTSHLDPVLRQTAEAVLARLTSRGDP